LNGARKATVRFGEYLGEDVEEEEAHTSLNAYFNIRYLHA